MEAAHPNNRLRDTLLFIFSLVSMLVLLGRGLYLVITSFVPVFTQASADLPSNIYGAVSMLFCAILLMPVIILSLRRLHGQSISTAHVPPIKLGQVFALISLWVLSVILSSILGNLADFGWAVAIPFYLIGITIPILLLIWVAIGGLPTGSWRRLWSALGIGMTASTLGAIILEVITVGAALLIVGIVAVFDPNFKATLEGLVRQYNNVRNMQDLLPLLTPYLNNPVVFLAILLFVSGLGPLIEETFKPLAVWLVGKRLHSPAEGFALGALCGAGFALLEGMLVTSNTTEMLGFSVAGRATSSLMHITASGIMGWGIASALLEKRYRRLAGVYLLSIAIHGLWNGSVLLTVFGGLKMSVATSQIDILGGIATVIGVGILGIMLLSILIVLPIINKRLRTASAVVNEQSNPSQP
jgi:hypothetical protein